MLEIKHKENGSKGEFYIGEDGQRLAEMTYSWAGDDKFIIDHTHVEDELRGQNVGVHLVNSAVEFARSKGVIILPLCPFAKSVFNKDSSIRDVLFGYNIHVFYLNRNFRDLLCNFNMKTMVNWVSFLQWMLLGKELLKSPMCGAVNILLLQTIHG